MHRSLLVVVACSLILVLGQAPPVAADGPWRAQVVDAETKQPMGSVIVLAMWTKHVRSPGGPSSEYHDSEEVLTDKEGRFTIAARSFFSLNPLVFFRGPEFLFFKPGYGLAVWPGYKDYDKWPEEKRKALSPYAKLFQLDSIAIELPRLKTLEERKEYLGAFRGGFLAIPREKMPLLEKAIKEERKAVGYRD